MKTYTLGKTMEFMQKIFNFVDDKLYDHGEKVAYIYWKMLNYLESYNKEDIKKLTLLSFLHDIGSYKTEIGIDEETFELKDTKRHSIYGYLFLKYLSPLQEYSEIILHHHDFNDEFFNVLERKYNDEIKLLYIADLLEVNLRFDLSMNILDCIKKDNPAIIETYIYKFLKSSELDEILKNISTGNYKKEFYEHFNTYEISNKEVKDIITMIMFVIDFRSPQTVNHSFDVAAITALICRKLKMSEIEIRKMSLEAFVHDIGKITIPIDILEKKGKLTHSEMEIMKKHVVQSKKIVDTFGIDNFGEILLQHHEKLDGSGYPLGLTENEIHYKSKILAVVDIFSALISKRSYKKELPKNTVIAILSKMVKDNKIDKGITNLIIKYYDELVVENKKLVAPYKEIQEKINLEYNLLESMI